MDGLLNSGVVLERLGRREEGLERFLLVRCILIRNCANASRSAGLRYCAGQRTAIPVRVHQLRIPRKALGGDRRLQASSGARPTRP